MSFFLAILSCISQKKRNVLMQGGDGVVTGWCGAERGGAGRCGVVRGGAGAPHTLNSRCVVCGL